LTDILRSESKDFQNRAYTVKTLGNGIFMSDQIEQPPVAAELPTQPISTTPPQEELVDIDLFRKIKFRVGRVEACEAVPKSKKLLKLQVDLGEKLGKRQILAGIAQFYTPENLIGRKIVVVANLKPAQLMGLESQGMLLAASNAEVSSLIVVDPGQEMELGAEVR